MNNRYKGFRGESVAVEHINSLGGKILERNYTVRGGEIDIIYLDGDTVVFCEVKSRATGQYGAPSEAVGYYKKQRISRAALIYAKEHKITDWKLRFDILEILGDKINHIKNAFECAVKF